MIICNNVMINISSFSRAYIYFIFQASTELLWASHSHESQATFLPNNLKNAESSAAEISIVSFLILFGGLHNSIVDIFLFNDSVCIESSLHLFSLSAVPMAMVVGKTSESCLLLPDNWGGPIWHFKTVSFVSLFLTRILRSAADTGGVEVEEISSVKQSAIKSKSTEPEECEAPKTGNVDLKLNAWRRTCCCVCGLSWTARQIPMKLALVRRSDNWPINSRLYHGDLVKILKNSRQNPDTKPTKPCCAYAGAVFVLVRFAVLAEKTRQLIADVADVHNSRVHRTHKANQDLGWFSLNKKLKFWLFSRKFRLSYRSGC